MIKKRHFYNGVHYTIDKEKNVVILKKEFHEKLLSKNLWGKFGFKKIGGSSLGDVLLTDSYKSQFKAFCRMSWIDLPIIDRKYVDAGIAIEPMVINKLALDKNVKEIKTYPAEKFNFDYFKDIDPILGGLPDGLAINNDSSYEDIVIEIKTTGYKNKEKWEEYGVPTNYLKQAQMYTHLMKKRSYVIVAAFLDEDDYAEPEKYNIDKYPLFIKAYKVDKDNVNDDIIKVKSFYNEYTKTGISPKFNIQKDHELLKYLECKNEEEWKGLYEEMINK
ncbi:MAG: YqaJ viral recombinase family protein [Mycoplasma sp.]|nr:YqaJ viral recombinase family protein [Mycoplasma sp.]